MRHLVYHTLHPIMSERRPSKRTKIPLSLISSPIHSPAPAASRRRRPAASASAAPPSAGARGPVRRPSARPPPYPGPATAAPRRELICAAPPSASPTAAPRRGRVRSPPAHARCPPARVRRPSCASGLRPRPRRAEEPRTAPPLAWTGSSQACCSRMRTRTTAVTVH